MGGGLGVGNEHVLFHTPPNPSLCDVHRHSRCCLVEGEGFILHMFIYTHMFLCVCGEASRTCPSTITFPVGRGGGGEGVCAALWGRTIAPGEWTSATC
jgi:hypothetical protein